MTPKEKAEELVRKYYSFGLNNPAQSFSWYECKQCALIAVDEILDLTKKNKYNWQDWNEIVGVHYDPYWQEVKEEIEKL
jgi:hypothetical protein